MPFDIASARKHYSDDEIRAFLNDQIDVDGALGAGYSLDEIASFVSKGFVEQQQSPGIQPVAVLREGTKGVVRAPLQVAKTAAAIGARGKKPSPMRRFVQEAVYGVPGIGPLARGFSMAEKAVPKKVYEKAGEAAGAALESPALRPEPIERPTGIKGYVQDVIRAVPQVAAQIGVSTIHPAAGAAFMASQVAGGQLEQLEEKGIEPERAMQAALTNAALQAPLEMLPILKVLQKFGGTKAAGAVARRVMQTMGSEWITEFFQKYQEAATTIWAEGKGKGANEQAQEFWDNLLDITKEAAYEATVLAPLSGGGAVGSAIAQKAGAAARTEDLKTEAIANGKLAENLMQLTVPVKDIEMVEPAEGDFVPVTDKDIPSGIKMMRYVGPGSTPPIETEALAVAKNVDGMVDELVVQGQRGAVDLTAKKKSIVVPESVNPEAEARLTAAKGLKKPPVYDRIKEWTGEVSRSFTRHFPLLDPKADGAIIDILRNYENVSAYARESGGGVLRGITANLDPHKYDVFARNLIYKDMLGDIDRGLFEQKELPFGYKGREEIETDLRANEEIVNANSDIKNALATRNKFMEMLRKELVDKKLLGDDVLENENYFHHQVLQYMALKEMASPGLSSGDVRLHKKGWQRARVGAKDFNTEYLESEFEVVSQAMAQLETIKTLDKIKAEVDISKVLKAGDPVPNGYVKWQPILGRVMYPVNTITEKVLNRVIKEQGTLTEGDIGKAIALGKERAAWVIPKRLAKTLDNFREFKDEGPVGDAAKALMRSWKAWVIINPSRVLKYNINNLSGDMDIVLAYNPAIMKRFKQSAVDLWQFNIKKKAPTHEILTAIKKGVIGSGFKTQEVGDVSQLEFFKHISGRKPSAIKKAWNRIAEFTEYRENILRLAAYRHFKEELATGKNLYGASKRPEVDAVKDLDDKAAKLARELIGDYGNISQAGQWIRSHAMPFYSWMEINAPRYLRLFQNLPHEGARGGRTRTAAMVGARTAVKAGTLMAKAGLLYSMVQLWNHTFFPDEERELGEARRQQHIILGRNPETDEIISLRFQGALSDAMSWVGAEDLPYDVADVITGKKTIAEKGVEAAEAFGNRIFGAIGPQFKLPLEVAIGKSTYPSVTRPRPIRDRAEHALRAVSLDVPHRALTGKPMRGITDEVMRAVVYTTDPGEQAFFDTWKMVSDFKEKQGHERPSFSPSKKGNALYYYKKAIVYGDKKAQRKWLKEYQSLGGTSKGLKKSMGRSNPISILSLEDRKKFIMQLSETDKEIARRGMLWHRRIYGGN